MNYPIKFISLGPGEAELITVKALRLLNEADVIFCPSTIKKNGDIVSRSGDILEELSVDISKIHYFNVPMSKQRDRAHAAYDDVFTYACSLYEKGEKVAIVAEGDAGFYSSIQYIQDKFMEKNIPVERTAGVPAFIAAGAFAGLHIVKQEEPLLVFPGIVTSKQIVEAVDSGKTIVVMKLSQCEAAIKDVVLSNPNFNFHYFENVGTAKQKYITSKENIMQYEFPYFSLMMIKLGI